MGPRHPIWAHCGFLCFLEETVRWVRASAPTGCSPRGLGGMSYPFKGFKLSKWVRLGKTRGHAGQFVTLRVPARGKVRRCLVFHVRGELATGA
jgi:hypothetical protein